MLKCCCLLKIDTKKNLCSVQTKFQLKQPELFNYIVHFQRQLVTCLAHSKESNEKNEVNLNKLWIVKIPPLTTITNSHDTNCNKWLIKTASELLLRPALSYLYVRVSVSPTIHSVQLYRFNLSWFFCAHFNQFLHRKWQTNRGNQRNSAKFENEV